MENQKRVPDIASLQEIIDYYDEELSDPSRPMSPTQEAAARNTIQFLTNEIKEYRKDAAYTVNKDVVG